MSRSSDLRRLPSSVWPESAVQAPLTSDVLTQIAAFCKTLGYAKTVKALTKEAETKGDAINFERWPVLVDGPLGQDLGRLYLNAMLDDEEDDEGEDSDSDEDVSRLIDDEVESTSDEASEEDSALGKTEQNTNIKRKRDMGDSLSTASSAAEEEKRPAKRSKVLDNEGKSKAMSDSGSSDDSSNATTDSDDSDSSDSDSTTDDDSVNSNGGDDSTSDSDSSDLSTSDGSSSEDESDSPSSLKSKRIDVTRKVGAGSVSASSSATLAASPQPTAPGSEEEVGSMHPSRQARMDKPKPKDVQSKPKEVDDKQQRRDNAPFSRIPKNTTVDPRFASNQYVPYDWANKAWQDLSLTKGKGFTKEKNKKKRGP